MMVTQPTTSVPGPKRRWFQFSLQTLLLAVLVLSLPLSWLGTKLRRAREQYRVVAEIRDLGGAVSYDGRGSGSRQWPELPRPAWLYGWLGRDFYYDVAMVEHYSPRSDGRGIPPLATLKKLTDLELNGPGVTDTGLAQLRALPNLQSLKLSGTRVTDAGLTNLKHLTELEYLVVADTPITDEGLRQLGQMAKLRVLGLYGTRVSDAGLVHLKGLSNLEGLLLDGTQATADGLNDLRKALPRCDITGP